MNNAKTTHISLLSNVRKSNNITSEIFYFVDIHFISLDDS